MAAATSCSEVSLSSTLTTVVGDRPFRSSFVTVPVTSLLLDEHALRTSKVTSNTRENAALADEIRIGGC